MKHIGCVLQNSVLAAGAGVRSFGNRARYLWGKKKATACSDIRREAVIMSLPSILEGVCFIIQGGVQQDGGRKCTRDF